ncbi:hypothetical protein [Elizabethkingia anophelis]|uniref:hypothetical protein n=1 Tax=Elizabethkingia anophelis TaxID=1117645 RepID=UPI0002437AA6|nr:hypothetical protein [Elizabethkingia anophelis]ATC39609.1 hypothetical protein EAAG1_006985 [Elizabethkingia anophelis Ag1]ATC43288.1 hypothetical protein CMV41_06985 [Elizabethkingia anophelis]ATC46964.1 hypothetical protein CMV40_06985 [Elizabethkingia anophelis]MCQ0429374.1 hypothetical protein [Elizabethkingia anophelis]
MAKNSRKSLEGQKAIINTYTFSSGNDKLPLKEYQSPRGVRVLDKRPDLIIIDCYNEFNGQQLDRYIKWLEDIRTVMKWQ